MGYTTDFTGSLKLTPPATKEQIEYINTFSATRRMMRCTRTLQKMYNREFGLDGFYGKDGEYFIGGKGTCGQDRDDSVFGEGNEPPRTQPGLWCEWVLSKHGNKLKWNGSEKFYNYGEWLRYMIDNFFKRWGIILNGEINWQGADPKDKGTILVKDNYVFLIGIGADR